MARRIAQSTLNASTVDILNVIRQNASYQYQSMVPEISTAVDIPKVGEVLYGTPALANEFINSLVNRIAIVRTQSLTFNNPYSVLKKGYLEFGESIEDIFVNIAKAVDYSAEKAEDRELKRTLPDVRSAFHVINWKVFYPVTIQDEDLRMAFLSADGVTDLIAKIVDQVYTGAEYDEFLLFKYMLIKAVAGGKMKPVSIGDGTDLKDSAKAFRGISNLVQFPSSAYNESGVKTNIPKDRQVIFMDAMFDAEFDVEVLASAFNMDKAEYMGRRFLIDDWTTFDNDRFDVIRANSDGLEEVTSDELAIMADVKAILCDEKWFQVYDNNNKFTEKYVASGLYWNYFYHTWKTVSHSPFADAVVFVESDAGSLTAVAGAEYTVESVQVTDGIATVVTLSLDSLLDANGSDITGGYDNVQFEQNENLTEAGIAVQRYGAIIIPDTQTANAVLSSALTITVNGTVINSAGAEDASGDVKALSALAVGDTIAFSLDV